MRNHRRTWLSALSPHSRGPPLAPPLWAVDAYASQSEATWTEWMTNLHESDVELLKKGAPLPRLPLLQLSLWLLW